MYIQRKDISEASSHGLAVGKHLRNYQIQSRLFTYRAMQAALCFTNFLVIDSAMGSKLRKFDCPFVSREDEKSRALYIPSARARNKFRSPNLKYSRRRLQAASKYYKHLSFVVLFFFYSLI